jgi:membrane fusion protein, multidrug efflux system
MSKKKLVLWLLTLIVLAGVGWLLYQRHGASNQAANASNQGAATQEASALVKTQPLQMQPVTDTLTVYGDVMTGKVESINFPRAGQVSRLLVVQGQRVKQGTPLATLVSDPNTQMTYNQAVNAANSARGELKRIKELFSLQLATQSQVDNARRALQDAQANLAAQRKLGGELGSATVTAPFDGVVTALAVGQGDRIQPGATILQLGHTDSLRVQFGIEPDDSRLVKVGMPVILASVQNAEQTISAAITQMQELIDPKTQLINAMVELPVQPAGLLVPGMRVKGTIQVGEHKAWAVPRQAVLTDDQGTYIFQVSQGRARRVNVTKGQESQGLVAISGAMDTHLPVVVLGNYELQDGMKVREGAQ